MCGVAAQCEVRQCQDVHGWAMQGKGRALVGKRGTIAVRQTWMGWPRPSTARCGRDWRGKDTGTHSGISVSPFPYGEPDMPGMVRYGRAEHGRARL